jgi:hypothetical protein
MCGGRRRRRAARQAAQEQERLNKLAEENQNIINNNNALLEIKAAEQETQISNFTKAQEAIVAGQNQAQANFAAMQAAQAAQLAAEKARIEQQNRVNQSVSQSLQVLATKDKKKKKVPMAGKDPSRKGEGNQARYNSPTKDLRVGFSEREGGVGVNLGG